MQFSIKINQKAYIDNFPTLDIKDAAIVDFLVEFTHAPNLLKKMVGQTVYYWFDYQKIVDEMPILGLSKEAIRKRVRGICATGILMAHDGNQGAKCYFAFGPNFQKIVRGHREENTEVEKTSGNSSRRVGKSVPNFNQNIGTDFPIDHNTNKDHYTNINEKAEIENADAVDFEIEIVEPSKKEAFSIKNGTINPIESVNNKDQIERLTSDFRVKEVFTMSRKIPSSKFDEYVKAFELEIDAREKVYFNVASFREHFFSFSAARHRSESGAAMSKNAQPETKYTAPTKPEKIGAYTP